LHAPSLQKVVFRTGHALPQVPQLFGSDLTSTQLPLQLVEPGGHCVTHAPFAQAWPPTHAFPHVPQFCGSVSMFTQELPPFAGEHAVRPVAHVTPQAPLAHAGAPVPDPDTGAAHTIEQLPQWLGSELSWKQPLAHLSGKLGASQVKPQLPCEQTAVPFAGAVHWAPQPPQFARSEDASTHALPHAVKPVAQPMPQPVASQVATPFAGTGQTAPQAPQLSGSLLSLTHALPHLAKPALQVKPQADALHVAVPLPGGAQTVPHAPQLWVSLLVSMQLWPQVVCPLGQCTMQTPAAQTWFAPHAVPHAPQFSASLWVLTQPPAQAVNDAAQLMPHWPFWHVAAPFAGTLHALPQAPQFAVSPCSFTQAPEHAVKPALHVKPQLPDAQVGAAFGGALHTSPQVPQLLVSVATVTQEPLQFVVPLGHAVVQVAAAHTWFTPQAFPQVLQFAGSVCSFTQAPPHAE
jgi:hypothetical protein